MFPSVTSGSESYCGVKSGDVFISYKMIWQDVREAMNYVHIYVSTFSFTFSLHCRYQKEWNPL